MHFKMFLWGFGRTLVLAAVLLGLYGLTVNLGVPWFASTYVASYTPMSEAEALARARESLAEQLVAFDEAQRNRRKDPCWSLDWREELGCRSGFRKVESYTVRPSLNLEAVKAYHRYTYEQTQLPAAVEQTQTAVDYFFAALSVLLGGWTLWRIRRGWSVMNFRLAIGGLNGRWGSRRIGTLLGAHLQRRSLEKAREEIDTLEKLLNSGILTNDEFDKRREEIKTRLRL